MTLLAHPVIDTTFDFRTDSNGKDPDSYSPTLKRYHKLLWSKPLPNGVRFTLEDAPRGYLRHISELGEFYLGSDSAIHTFSRWKRMTHIIDQIPPEESENFRHLSYTMGGMMIFPSNRVDNLPTINGARGFNRQICDRIDLTLECISRHYAAQDSPLRNDLLRYDDFFSLFQDFRGYIDFFLLQDLVSDDYAEVKFLMPFSDFTGSAVPGNLEEYLNYRATTLAFVRARNSRIDSYAKHYEN
jgi:hypothetical protein